ncbi:hypothetical protein [Streptomyces sp. 3N207]|uniref:hypothetical protein n=1 Tax=Streptomyces sp. 3N207 TaxID=3457417 RepID=UPI003FD0C3C0
MPGGDRSDTSRLVVPSRYNGPAHSAQGGLVCGLLAGLAEPRLGPDVVVTLHAPPPLETALELRPAGRRYALYERERLVAVVAAARRPPPPPPAWVPYARAQEAAEHFEGVRGHPFPDCFVCGPDRPDGLGLRPGRVPGETGTVASPWHPRPEPAAGPGQSVPAELVWAALDCPGGWADDPVGRPMVLHRIAARIEARPRAGDVCVLVGRVTRRQERTSENVTALYDVSGALLARAAATWVAVGTGTGTGTEQRTGRETEAGRETATRTGTGSTSGVGARTATARHQLGKHQTAVEGTPS